MSEITAQQFHDYWMEMEGKALMAHYNDVRKEIRARQNRSKKQVLDERKLQILAAQEVIVKCRKCLIEGKSKDMFHMTQKNSYTGESENIYECADEKGCRQRSMERAEEIHRIKKAEEEEERAKYAHLTKEGLVEAKFGVKFDDLIELSQRFRDASIHYRHKDTGKIYSWSWAGGPHGSWYVPNERYSNSLQKYVNAND